MLEQRNERDSFINVVKFKPLSSKRSYNMAELKVVSRMPVITSLCVLAIYKISKTRFGSIFITAHAETNELWVSRDLEN